jgi:hypothetical protein
MLAKARGVAFLILAAAVAPASEHLAWNNPPMVATNLAGWPGWQTTIESTTNLRTWP